MPTPDQDWVNDGYFALHVKVPALSSSTKVRKLTISNISAVKGGRNQALTCRDESSNVWTVVMVYAGQTASNVEIPVTNSKETVFLFRTYYGDNLQSLKDTPWHASVKNAQDQGSIGKNVTVQMVPGRTEINVGAEDYYGNQDWDDLEFLITVT